MGGENSKLQAALNREVGSSPRGRGKLFAISYNSVYGRLIPAWAGKTGQSSDGARRLRAHPRVGGENGLQHAQVTLQEGSSPRGRGKLVGVLLRTSGQRLIPAWAGKTVPASISARRRWAHPRVGGENLRLGRHHAVVRGSSPRGRGKPESKRPVHEDARLIPAWAGKTCASGWTSLTAWAHPRVGGENIGASWLPTIVKGSSPRGRGKPGGKLGDLRARGLIPAWAGKTETPASWATSSEAHPRVGGENARVSWRARRSVGSSPRGRGKPDGGCRRVGVGRLIPAWAGKTRAVAGGPASRRAHPRVGGENASMRMDVSSELGSSPRGRGKLKPALTDFMGVGLIPAWAGKTPQPRRG